jgi:hypothetical protein
MILEIYRSPCIILHGELEKMAIISIYSDLAIYPHGELAE